MTDERPATQGQGTVARPFIAPSTSTPSPAAGSAPATGRRIPFLPSRSHGDASGEREAPAPAEVHDSGSMGDGTAWHGMPATDPGARDDLVEGVADDTVTDDRSSRDSLAVADDLTSEDGGDPGADSDGRPADASASPLDIGDQPDHGDAENASASSDEPERGLSAQSAPEQADDAQADPSTAGATPEEWHVEEADEPPPDIEAGTPASVADPSGGVADFTPLADADAASATVSETTLEPISSVSGEAREHGDARDRSALLRRIAAALEQGDGGDLPAFTIEDAAAVAEILAVVLRRLAGRAAAARQESDATSEG